MSLEERRKQSFGKVVEDYDKYRPSYPADVLNLLKNEFGLNANSKVLEIGCGTGQFTQLIAPIGCDIDAVDISNEMISYAKSKLDQPNVKFYNASFEDFATEPNKYDFIVSATAFHWVTPIARLNQTAKVLKDDGLLCYFYNHNDFQTSTEPVRLAIQAVYDRLVTRDKETKKVKVLEDKVNDLSKELDQAQTFNKAGFYAFDNTVTYSTEDYIGVLGTYSYQNTLPTEQRKQLFAGIREAVNAHGGSVRIPYETKVYCYKKARHD